MRTELLGGGVTLPLGLGSTRNLLIVAGSSAFGRGARSRRVRGENVGPSLWDAGCAGEQSGGPMVGSSTIADNRLVATMRRAGFRPRMMGP